MILFYVHKLGLGGAEFALIGAANRFQEAGSKVVFALGARGGAAEDGLHPGIEVIEFGTRRTICDVVPLVALLRSRRPRVAITSLLRCNFVLALAAVLAKFRGDVVLRETTPIYERFRASPLRLLGLQIIYSFMALVATRVVIPDDSICLGLRKLSRLYASKTRIVPNAVRVCYRARKTGTSNRLLVVGVGRLEPVKGFDLLISACSKFNEADLHLHIFGDGSLRGSLEELARKSGFQYEVIKGAVLDVQRVYEGHDLLVCSSHHEGFPNVVVEAAVCGLGVLLVGHPHQYATLKDLLMLPEACFINSRDPDVVAHRIRMAKEDLASFQAPSAAIHKYLACCSDRIMCGYVCSDCAS